MSVVAVGEPLEPSVEDVVLPFAAGSVVEVDESVLVGDVVGLGGGLLVVVGSLAGGCAATPGSLSSPQS